MGIPQTLRTCLDVVRAHGAVGNLLSTVRSDLLGSAARHRAVEVVVRAVRAVASVVAVGNDRLRSDRQRRTIDRLARWLVRTHGTEPGWDALVLDVLSVGRDVRLQVREVRGEGTVAHAVAVGGRGSRARRLVRALQEDYADLVDGTWLSATLIVSVAERRWARPGVELVLNYADEPLLPAHAPHPVAAEDYRRHLARHRRMDRRIPGWLRERVAGAGLEVPER